jgi:hypothetical protein
MNITAFLLFIILYLVESIISQRSRGVEHNFNDYINLDANRTIDLSQSIMHIKSKILIKSNKVDPIYLYKFPILKNSCKYLININAKLQSLSGEEVANLKVSKQQSSNDTFNYYEINFKSEPMNHEEERLLIITENYYERLEFLPKKISLKDDQLAVLTDSSNLISFYKTLKQKTEVILPSERSEIM